MIFLFVELELLLEIIEVVREREELQQELKEFDMDTINQQISQLEGQQDVLQSQMSQT